MGSSSRPVSRNKGWLASRATGPSFRQGSTSGVLSDSCAGIVPLEKIQAEGDASQENGSSREGRSQLSDTASARGVAFAQQAKLLNAWPKIRPFAASARPKMPQCLMRLRNDHGAVDRRSRGVWARPPSASAKLTLAWDGHEIMGEPGPTESPRSRSLREGSASDCPRSLGTLPEEPYEKLWREKERLQERWGRRRRKILHKVIRLVRSEQEWSGNDADMLRGAERSREEGKASRYRPDLCGETASQASAELFESQMSPDKYHFHSEPMTKSLARARLPRRGVRTFTERGDPHQEPEVNEHAKSVVLQQQTTVATDYSSNFRWPPELAYTHKKRQCFKKSFPEGQRVDMKILTPFLGAAIHHHVRG